MKIKSSYFYSFIYALLVVFFSSIILPLYVGGDQRFYTPFYSFCLNDEINLAEQFSCYRETIGAQEPVYFVFAKFFSYFLSKNIFSAITNFFLVVAFVLVVFKYYKRIWHRHLFILLMITNYYSFVLYFSTERLKYGFLFLLISFLFVSKIKYLSLIFSILSHMQMFFNILPYILSNLINSTAKFWIKVTTLIVSFFVFLLVGLLMKDQILNKFSLYYEDTSDSNMGIIGVIKTSIFIVLASISVRKIEPVFVGFPIIISSYFIGSTRLGMVAFILFVSYVIQYKGKMDIICFIVLCYFSYKSIDFVLNVFAYGQGWNS